MRQALGDEFVDNALRVDDAARGRRAFAAGSACRPIHKPNALSQYVFVNGRAMRDKLIAGALRAAYQDYLPRDRHGALALFLACDPRDVDVNVHPAKAEVRFRESGLVRGLIVSAVRQALEVARHRAATTGGAATLASCARRRAGRRAPAPANWDWRASPAAPARRLRRAGAGSLRGLRAQRAAPAPRRRRRGRRRARRSARRGRNCTRTISSRRPATAW